MSGSPGPECLAAAEKVRFQFLSLSQSRLKPNPFLAKPRAEPPTQPPAASDAHAS